jgi:hypothetical protein
MRKQFSIRINYAEMANEMTRIFDKAKASNNGKKPVARIEVSGLDIDPRTVAASLVRLNNYCLHYVWQPVEEGRPGATAYDSRPADMDSELYRLSAKALESEELAQFAIEEILPLSANGDAGAVLDLVWEAYRSKRFGKDVSK